MLFAESLGCGPAVLLKSSPKVQVDRMILSGPEYPDFGVMNKLLLKIMPPKLYRTAHEKSMPAWVLRFMGQTEQGMQTMRRFRSLRYAASRGFGHGDIINHPQQLAEELTWFMR